MIGVDLIRVDRVAKLSGNDVNNRVFTRNEVEYANTKAIVKTRGEVCSQRDNTYAGFFAAKEAFLKALGLGIGDEFKLCEVEISHYGSGQPYIVISDKIKEFLKQRKLTQVNLSISHDSGFAIAVVDIK